MRCLVRAALYAAVVLNIGATVVAQTLVPRDQLRLMADVSRYRGGDDATILVEVAYSVPEWSLTYKADSAGYNAALDLTMMVMKGDSVVAGDRWLVPRSVRDTTSLASGMNLVGLYRFQVGEGDYVLRVVGRDRHDLLRRDSMSLKFPARAVVTDRSVLSDVELATTIRQGTKGSLFFKNTLDVIPNVGGLYHEDQSVFYYAEAYNLLAGGATSDYLLRTSVYDAVGKEVIGQERPRKRSTESSVIVNQFPAKNLKSGTYTLVLSLIDSAGKPMSSSGRKFYIFNPTLGVDSSMLQASSGLPLPEYMSMEEPELDREFQWSRYLVREEEKGQFEQLKGVDAKRKFLTDFWRRRPPGYRDEYMSRSSFANSNFAVLGREGYRTDRGRVMIVYGQPDDIERHPSETDMRPYEIWSYNNIQGGVLFVFVLRNAAGDYELVHSTHRNELRDDNWDRPGITR